MAELTTTATGDTWHEAVQAAVDEAAELLGDAQVWRVDVESITTLRIYSEEPKVARYQATVTSRPARERRCEATVDTTMLCDPEPCCSAARSPMGTTATMNRRVRNSAMDRFRSTDE